MSIEVLLVQFLILAFTGAVWWLARRDLASRPAPPLPAAAQADARELEQLCVTLEALVTDLAARMEAAERRLQEVRPSPAPVPMPAPASAPTVMSLSPMPPFAPPPEAAPVGIVPAAVPVPMAASVSVPAPVSAPAPMPALSALPPSASFPVFSQDLEAAEPEIAAHAPLYALLEAGVTDPAEITRRTGLGRGEVDLILSLRARRAL